MVSYRGALLDLSQTFSGRQAGGIRLHRKKRECSVRYRDFSGRCAEGHWPRPFPLLPIGIG